MMPEMPPPITARGALVWRDMDQKALDDAYDQDVYAPNRPLIVPKTPESSQGGMLSKNGAQRSSDGT